MSETLDGGLFGAAQPCFGCGPQHPIGFRLSFVREGEDVVTRFVPGEQYQGPPGIMHGGLVMTLADEVGAWAIVAGKERFGFTVRVDGQLRRAVRIGREVEGRARITKDLRRLVDVAVEVRQDDETCFSGSLRFAVLDEEGAARGRGP